ncbi:MAG: hypothetical protein Q8S18_04175 [Bacteroidales bacterium]|nr:hypothetical protein [Bacteroidales bacterium]
MEDYFYIIIGILWVVFSVIKASRKNKPVDTIETDDEELPESRPSSLEDILGEFLEPDTYKRREKTITEIEYVDEPVVSLEEQFIQSNQYNQYTGVIGDATESTLETFQSLEDDDSPGALTNTQITDTDITIQENREALFDLRKAVIYQAILQRPYA